MALSQERKGTLAVSLTNFLDSGCIVASGVALAAWAVAFGFGSTWTAILGAVGANAFGAAVGALIGGFLTDKLGRKFIYTYNMLVYAAGVFIVMISVNLPMLLAGIVISGLSVGAGVPASWSYISEMSGSNRRASNIGISQFAWSCGPAVIFLISLVFSLVFPTFAANGELLPAGTYGPFDGLFAMRLLFAILFVVALFAWNLQRKLQESTDWTSKQELKEKESFVSMMRRALTNAVNIKTIVFLVAVYLTWNIVAGTMGQFMPYMYAAAGNLDDTTISLLQTVMWVLTAIGSLAIFSALGDKVPHRILFALTAGMALAASMCYDHLEEKVEYMRQIKSHFVEEVLKLPDTVVHGLYDETSAPHIISVGFAGVRSEVLLHALEDKGICVSAGSACASNHPAISGVLKGIGAKKEYLDATIRFSMSEMTTEEEMDYTLQALQGLVPMLRRYTRH